MELSKDEIIKWFYMYNYPENEDIILNSIDTLKTWEDFKYLILGNDGILKWKGALRTKHYYDSLDSLKWTEFLDISKSSLEKPKETVKNIRSFSIQNMKYKEKSGGISYPVASTIVYFFSNGNCPIIDWRVIFALKNKGYEDQLKRINLYYSKKTKSYQIYLGDYEWDIYYDLCQEIVSKLNINSIGNDSPIRVLDKALWIYPDLKKNVI
jgi:hypothetical protein